MITLNYDKLFLVRHAEYEHNKAGFDVLTQKGKEQMRIAAEKIDPLLNGEYATLLTSSERRAALSLFELQNNLGNEKCLDFFFSTLDLYFGVKNIFKVL